MKPLLLIDVDGVLNCFGSIWTDDYELEHFTPIEMAFDRYPIRCRKQTRERLARVLKSFEPVWATAWEENAHPFWGSRLGLGEEAWPHVNFTSGRVPLGGTWKLPTIRRLGDTEWSGRPLAWIDDDLQADADRWAIERSVGQNAPTLLVKTAPHEGLGDREEARLLAFAESIAEMEQRQ